MDKRMLSIIQNYFTTQPVVKAWIFGSFARGEANDQSDIDILVTLDKNAHMGLLGFAAMSVDLEGMLNRTVDIVVDDCVKFVEREIRRGNRYDAVIMDPPSYGRGPKGEIWKIEEQIHSFVQLTTQVLKEEPLFFLINSYTTGLQPALLSYLLGTELRRFSGHIESSEIGLPVRESGLVLPCGASGRFEAKL